MKPILALVLLYLFTNCNGQTTASSDELKLSNIKFESIFGHDLKDTSSKMYCLLGNDFIRTPSSGNADSLITNWVQKHSNANVIPVTASEMEMDEKHHKIKLIYCWLIGGKDTINNYLVRNGCFPGQTMIRPSKWEEMPTEQKEIFDNDKVGYGTTEVFIDDKTFDRFMEQIHAADQYAYEHYLGIWKDEELRNGR